MLDCEAVAWDRSTNSILPFQVLQTRKRKDVASADVSVCVCIFAFDLLYFNGRALTQETFRTRRELMHKNFRHVDGGFHYATSNDGKSIDDIQVCVCPVVLIFRYSWKRV